MADEIFTQRLLNWAVKEKGMEALKLVIPIVEDKYRITSYGFKRTPGTGGKLKSRFFKNRELYLSNLPQNSNCGRELDLKSGVQIPVREGHFHILHKKLNIDT